MRLRNTLFITLLCASASMAFAQDDNQVVRVRYAYGENVDFPRSSISSINMTYKQEYNEEKLAEQLRSNPDSVMALLYPKLSTAYISELMSDNMADFNVETATGTRQLSYSPSDDYIFSYQATPANTPYSLETDAPLLVWNDYCDAIHRCNLVLLNTTDRVLQGEAYLCRAWLHFQLASVFSPVWRDDAVSAQEKGLPYMKNIEHGQKIADGRLSVAEFYNQVETDLLQGLEMVGDAGTVYRFNQRSANAFAARFYLMKREWAKVLQYADAALGTGTPELRDWTEFEGCMYVNDFVRIWFGDSKTNLMLQDTSSLRSRRFGHRYGIIGEAAAGLGCASRDHYAPIIPGHANGYICLLSCVKGGGVWSSYGGEVFTSSKLMEVFEYTDEEAGIGFVHNFYIPFSVGETLFARAEARLYLGDWEGCLEDINLWAQNVDESDISLKYLHDWCVTNNDYFHLSLRPTDVSSAFVMPQSTFTDSEGTTITFEDMLQCLVHMRRMETYGQDCRLFDLKRYGMPIVHNAMEPQNGARHNYTMSYDEASDCHYYLPLPSENIVLGAPYYNIELKDGTEFGLYSTAVDCIDFSADLDADRLFAADVEAMNAQAPQGWVVQNFDCLGGTYWFEETVPVIEDGMFMIGSTRMTVDGCADGTWTCHSDDYYGRTECRLFPCPESSQESYDHAAIWQRRNALVMPYYVVKHDGQAIDNLTIVRTEIQDNIYRNDGSAFVLAYTPEGFVVKNGMLPESGALEFAGDEQNLTYTSADGHYTIEPDMCKYAVNSGQKLSIDAPNDDLSATLSNASCQFRSAVLDQKKQQVTLSYKQSRSTMSISFNVQISAIEDGLRVAIDWNDYLVNASASILHKDGMTEAVNGWLSQLMGDYIFSLKGVTFKEVPNENVEASGETYYEITDSWGNGFPMNIRSANVTGTFVKVGNPNISLQL